MKDTKLNWKFFFFYFFFLFSVLCFFSSGLIESEDGLLYLTVARNLYYNHQATSAPYEFNEGKNVHMNSVKQPDGTWRAPGGLGYSVAMVPAVAVSDLIHKYYGTAPPARFPLESDWSVLLFASFTNSFFAALLGIIMFKYGLALKLSNRMSLLLSLATVFATNIFPLSKFGFAHMIFITFTLCTFYCVKKYAQTEHSRYLLFSLISYLAVIVSYNDSYILPIPTLLLYIILLLYPKHRSVKRMLPGILLCFMFILFLKIKSILSAVSQIQPKILFEGAYGLLLSPGKSVFLYSPPLMLLIFWHRIQKRLLPEVLSFLLLLAIYVFSYGSATIAIPGAQELRPIWYGGAVWGPRYMAMLVPPLMLIVFHIITRLSSLQKKFLAIPVFVFGALIQLLGVAVPYQVQYRGLPYHFFINTTEITRYEYAGFIPRYSPIITMARDFLVKLRDFTKTLDHGTYGVRFYDGFETPLRTGIGVFRGIKSVGYLSFVQKAEKPVQSISLLLYNNPDEPTSTYSVRIFGSLNTHTLSESTIIPVSKDGSFSITPSAGIIQNGVNVLNMRVAYVGTTSAQHTLYVKKMVINGESVNLQSLDYPDVSTSLGEKTTPIPYQYWGKVVTDPWQLWNLRARIYEETFDFWWLKNVYYWDRPQTFLSVLFLMNIISIIFFFRQTRSTYKKK